MVCPRFSFFITQDDGTIFGSAVNPVNNERLAYVIAPDGSVTARCESAWYELPYDEAAYVRFLADRVYRFSTNYLTHRKVF